MEVKSHEEILVNTKNGIFAPLYFLHGEEEYFIDLICSFLENTVVPKHEKDFNQHILYGKDVDVFRLIELARGFPMMGQYQLIIVKEAQSVNRLADIEQYLDSLMETTILVFAHKHKKIDKRTTLYNTLKKHKTAVCFESIPLTKEADMASWVEKKLKSKGFSIDREALQLLLDYVGLDLAKMSNNLEKLTISGGDKKFVDKHLIEQNIGISKEYNVFELQKAIGARQVEKAYKIAKHMAKNPKTNSIFAVMGLLTGFFQKVYLYHFVSRETKDNKAVAAAIGIPPFFINQYQDAARNFSVEDIEYIFTQFKNIDLKLKGVGSRKSDEEALFGELMYHIFSSTVARKIAASPKWNMFVKEEYR